MADEPREPESGKLSKEDAQALIKAIEEVEREEADQQSQKADPSPEPIPKSA